MIHPTAEVLALFAGSDLGLFGRIRVGRHVAGCERCARHVEQFRDVRAFLDGAQDDMLPGVDWTAMAAEMRGNIRVGLAAGECVTAPAHGRIHVAWRTPAVALPVLLLIIAGWILQSVRPPAPLAADRAIPAAIVLEASPGGIGLERNGRGFQLLQPAAARDVVFSVRGDSVRSRYMDADTGQVTISHVYAE